MSQECAVNGGKSIAISNLRNPSAFQPANKTDRHHHETSRRLSRSQRTSNGDCARRPLWYVIIHSLWNSFKIIVTMASYLCQGSWVRCYLCTYVSFRPDPLFLVLDLLKPSLHRQTVLDFYHEQLDFHVELFSSKSQV